MMLSSRFLHEFGRIRIVNNANFNSLRCLSTKVRCPLSKEWFIKSTVPRPVFGCFGSQLARQTTAALKQNYDAETTSVIDNGKKLQVVWKDGKVSSYVSVWLRYNCHCEQCRELSSNMGRLIIAEMPTSFTIKNVQHMDNGLIRVNFEEGNHYSDFSLGWLKQNCYSKEALEERRKAARPEFNYQNEVPQLPYSEVAESERGLYRWLKSINENGLCVLKGAPLEWNHLYTVIQWIGPVSRNLYGELYDVEVQQVPINAAYTNESLQFHMDLTQYESPPGIQFLHCLRFDETISGGETTFVDLMQVAEKFRKDHPEDFDILTKVPCPFNRVHAARDHPVEMTTFRPILVLNNEKEIISISWHANLHGPLSVAEEFIEPFYKAFQLFGKAIHNSTSIKSIRFQPGDLIAFNNRRVAHGRNAFDDTAEGKRHLQGGYLQIDDYKSKLNVLHNKYGDGKQLKRIGNCDWF